MKCGVFSEWLPQGNHRPARKKRRERWSRRQGQRKMAIKIEKRRISPSRLRKEMEGVGARSWYFSCLILMHFVHSSNPCSDIWWNNQMSHYIMILQGGCYIYSIYRNIHTQLICWLFKRVWKTLLHYIEISSNPKP